MHNLSYLLRSYPKKWRAKLPKRCLWICKHRNIYKKCLGTFFNYFFKKKSFKILHLNTTEVWVQWTPTLIFLEVGHGKTKKPTRWLERSPKMRNSHSHCLQKVGKYEKQHPLSIHISYMYMTKYHICIWPIYYS